MGSPDDKDITGYHRKRVMSNHSQPFTMAQNVIAPIPRGIMKADLKGQNT